MSLPRDISILVSMLNLWLRDDDMSLETLIEVKGENPTEIMDFLLSQGYFYDKSTNQIKQKA